MKRRGAWIAFLGSLALLAAMAGLLLLTSPNPSQGPVVLFCAAGLRPAVEAAAKDYEKDCGVAVHLQYGGSQTILANAEVSRTGDLYLPADETYMDLARAKGLLDEAILLARMRPVLAVRKGNPKGIRGLPDLVREGVRVVQANPDAAAIGKFVRDALRRTGEWEKLKERTLDFKSTVNEVANDLKLGSADAGFVWDATVKQYPELEAVEVPALAGSEARISVGVLRSSRQPAAALRFARFLAARDRGQREFARQGFQPVEGDAWSEAPRLLVYAGAMLRPAIEETIKSFERREGAEVTTVYNGCGILVAQMKAGERPDAYFACDASFMADVKDLFEAPRDISLNQLVILVPKGNPHGVRSLTDLGKPGLRVGIGHEKQCALGALTKETLLQSKLYQQVMKNVVTQLPTGDMLVNSLLLGSLDAVVAYVSNATASADRLEGIAVDVPCALAVQPVAVGRGSARPQLASRLIDALRSVESRKRFESEGFRWKAAP